jgi:hypothetical protein
MDISLVDDTLVILQVLAVMILVSGSLKAKVAPA